jgi:hypothetical protein
MNEPEKEFWIYRDAYHYLVVSGKPVGKRSQHYVHESEITNSEECLAAALEVCKQLHKRVDELERNCQILMRSTCPEGSWCAPNEPIDAMRIAFFDALRNAFESKDVPATMPWIEAYKAMRTAYLESRK